MELAVIKRGPKVNAEIEYLKVLGPEVAPQIITSGDGCYVMEYLEPIRGVGLGWWPRQIENMLAERVWHRSEHHVEGQESWYHKLYHTTGIKAPDWSHTISPRCMTHGDCTLANTMQRPYKDPGPKGGEVGGWVLIDPVPPGHRVPQIRECDQSKIMQTMLGWETITGGMLPVEWEMPDFVRESRDSHLRRVLFWTGVTLVRAGQSVKVEWEKTWCDHLSKEIFRAIDL